MIQAFEQEETELQAFSQVSTEYYHQSVRAIRTWSTFFPVLHFLTALGGALVLGFGARSVINGTVTLGTLVAFLAYIASFYDPLRRLTEIDNTFQQAIAAGERIFEILDEESEIQNAPGAIKLEKTRGEVQFEDVHFRYGKGDGCSTTSISTSRRARSSPSLGQWRRQTSIANLICRFYDPAHGRVLLDGHDLRDLDLASLRQLIAVVLRTRSCSTPPCARTSAMVSPMPRMRR